MFPKNPPLRDPKWITHVRQCLCILTYAQHPDPAHIRWGLGGGTGLKSPDNRVLPLAHRLHVLQHSMPEAQFWRENITDEVLMEALIALAEKRYRIWKEK